jgi:hypothetical protein
VPEFPRLAETLEPPRFTGAIIQTLPARTDQRSERGSILTDQLFGAMRESRCWQDPTYPWRVYPTGRGNFCGKNLALFRHA